MLLFNLDFKIFLKQKVSFIVWYKTAVEVAYENETFSFSSDKGNHITSLQTEFNSRLKASLNHGENHYNWLTTRSVVGAEMHFTKASCQLAARRLEACR